MTQGAKRMWKENLLWDGHHIFGNFQHPDFDLDNTFAGKDIGLIYIEQGMDIDGNGFAATIPMAEEGSDWMGAECVITGWGEISLGNSFH